MLRLFAFLLSCSMCLADVSWPVSQAYSWEIPLWNGTSNVTGATVTCSIGKDTDADGIDDTWWTGSAWGSYTALSMTEETGNAHLSGFYKYLLSAAAVGGVTNVTINFRSTYTNGITILNTERLTTSLPTTGSDGGVLVSDSDAYVPGIYTIVSSQGVPLTTGAVQSIWDAQTSALNTSGSVGAALLDGSAGGLTSDEHTWLQYVYGRLGAVAVTVAQFVQTNGTISVTQNTDYPSGVIVLSRTWPYEDLTGATATFSAQPSVGGTVAINASSCTFTGGTTGSTLAVNIPLTHTQTASLSVRPYTYEVKIVLGSGRIYRPFTGTMNVSRYVN